jgi:uncharacterized membrane protein YczE
MRLDAVRQEVVKIRGRRAMFWCALVIPAGLAVTVLVVAAILRAVRPEDYFGGDDLLQAMSAGAALAGVVMGTLLGAQAGAYDVQQGTFRYLAMTGRPRLGLYLARVPALLAVLLAVLVPALVVAAVAGALMPVGDSVRPGLSDHALAVWSPLVQTWIYALVAFGIGALLRSVGVAIAVALVASLGALPVLSLVSEVSETAGDLVLPMAVLRLVEDTGRPLWLAAAVAVAWCAVFVGAGAARTVRAEY